MGERFEVELESAWSRFEADLIAVLRSLGSRRHRVDADSSVLVGGRYLEFVGQEGGPIVALVSGNTNLVSDYRLDKRHHAGLRALGWRRPSPRSNGDWWHESESGMEEHLASMSIATLRRVFGVVAPEFLPGVIPSDPADDGLEVGYPASAEEATQMVLQILREAGHQDVTGPDEDGDIHVELQGFHCWAKPQQELPVVTLWGVLLHGITRRPQAMLEVNVRNRREQLLRFSLDGDAIVWRCDVPADPLVAGQLNRRLAFARDRIAELGPDLRETIFGFRDGTPRPEASGG